MTITGPVYVGTAVTTSVQFKNSAGTPTDPTVVTLSFNLGAGLGWTTWTYGVDEEITRTGTGAYTADVGTSGATTATPVLTAQWNGSETCQAVGLRVISLQPPPYSGS